MFHRSFSGTCLKKNFFFDKNENQPAQQPAAKCVQMTSAANAIQATIYMKIWSAWMLATPKQGTIYKVFQSVLTFDATVSY